MNLTKTQINYFASRMSACVNSILMRLDEDFPAEKEPSKIEMAGMIANGSARFMEELFTGPDCPYHSRVFECFEFPDEEARRARNAALAEKCQKIAQRVRLESNKLIDQYVMGNCTPEEALEKLTETQFWVSPKQAQE